MSPPLPQLSNARTISPGLILRDYGKRSPAPAEDITRLYTYSYLTEEPSMGYLRKPIDPYDRPPKSPHFHRPQSKIQSNPIRFQFIVVQCWINVYCDAVSFGIYIFRREGGTNNKRSSLPYRLSQKPGMRTMIDQMERETPRPKSPHMNNEEPIELAHFPNANRCVYQQFRKL